MTRLLRLTAPRLLALMLMLTLTGCSGMYAGPKLAHIQVGPLPSVLPIGGHLQMIALGTYEGDKWPANISHEVNWVSSDPEILAVDPASGIATGVREGTVTVTASASLVTASVSVQVLGEVSQ